jgi:hypothetical protein
VERRGRGRGIRTMEIEMSRDDRPILLLSCLWFYDGRSFFIRSAWTHDVWCLVEWFITPV